MNLVGKNMRVFASVSRIFPCGLSRAFHNSTTMRGVYDETVRDFLEPADLFHELKHRGFDFYTGVPDSLLKDYCAYVTDNSPDGKHVIAANEGCAVGIGAGYYLATRKTPVVYMQNSGFGNTVNPLLSLADAKVYSIPLLLLIGWRGEPGKKDEPQHLVQGKAMSSLLTDMNISYEVMPDYIEGARESLDTAKHYLNNRKAPYALLIRRQCFHPYQLQNTIENEHEMKREDAIEAIVKEQGEWDVTIATTGFTSRELYEIRARHGTGHNKDFLTVGSMGHASSIAVGIAMAKKTRQVLTLDGDGACLMHMGAMAIPSALGLKNFKHVILNNGSHDSVGGQPTVGFDMDFLKIADGCGYKWVRSAETLEDLTEAFKELKAVDGPALLEVKVGSGARSNLGRPKTSPQQNKDGFMEFLNA